jgi:hypothetical protein
MSQPITDKDFQPLPSYTQTTTKNDFWVNVTLTKTDSDGTVTQTSSIISKR